MIIYLLHVIIICFTCSYNGFVSGISSRSYIYQKDMSEHCRRRVASSVFLGRRVVEAHSQVYDFFRMELPYSCFISIRAEYGNSIVLVVQLQSEESLSRACGQGSDQLVVYEMGETFGGYWGPLPHSVVRSTPVPVPTTLVTRTTTLAEDIDKEGNDETPSSNVPENTLTTDQLDKISDEGDFIRIEVPIVDVIAREVDKSTAKQQGYNSSKTHLSYDITPRQNDGRQEEVPRFKFDNEMPINTIDTRLTFPYGEKTTKRRRAGTNFYVNRLLKFKHTKTSSRSRNRTLYLKTNLFSKRQYIRSTRSRDPRRKSSRLPKSGLTYLNNADIVNINEIIKKLNISARDKDKFQNEKPNMSSIIETIANMKHNYSAYLSPDWESMVAQYTATQQFKAFTRIPLTIFNYRTKNIYRFRTTATSNFIFGEEMRTNEINFVTKINKSDKKISLDYKNVNENYNNSITNVTTASVKPTNLSYVQTLDPIQVTVMENFKISATSTQSTMLEVATTPELDKPLTGSMVGHASWDNVVQAAPVMAVILNKTIKTPKIANRTLTGTITTKPTTKMKKVRRKRNLQVVPIENTRPHNYITKLATTTAVSFKYSDMEEFSQLIELQDDEFHERVAFRYMRRYVGPSLFNLCANGVPKAKHVLIFNSSRVTMALTNFTLERMTVVMTPARTLVESTTRCIKDSLECQVYGTRICIDTTNACDGVPNCGAYDIYDEDRILCGTTGGIQHNVFLAAVAFLVLLLTLVYTVHYWLKRCVPKVSGAFFIYTNGTENVLNLETIMRSPHSSDENVPINHRQISDDGYFFTDHGDGAKKSIIRKILTACFSFCTCKRKKIQVLDLDIGDLSTNTDVPKKNYSSAELELNKMICREKIDAAMQTGESLEMLKINFKATNNCGSLSHKTNSLLIRRTAKIDLSNATLNEDHKRIDDLNILKLLEPAPSTSRDIPTETFRYHRGSIEEREIETHAYELLEQTEHSKHKSKKITNNEVPVEKTESTKHIVKHLRFDEEAIIIPCFDGEDGIQELSHTELEDGKKKDKTEECYTGANTGRDFRFWKSKKSKKKANL